MDTTNYFFLFARISAIVSRTLLLFFIVMQEGGESEAVDLALLLTVGVSLLMLSNIDVHREYYKLFFSEKKERYELSRKYTQFIRFFTGFSVVIYFVSVVVIYLIFESIFVSLIFSFNILFEKLFDEFQRFILFEKKYTNWSILALSMWALPVLLTITLYETMDVGIVNSYIFSSLIVNVVLLHHVVNKVLFLRIM